eukprot:7403451-Alexandrium_andersonii.AAC.1
MASYGPPVGRLPKPWSVRASGPGPRARADRFPVLAAEGTGKAAGRTRRHEPLGGPVHGLEGGWGCLAASLGR